VIAAEKSRDRTIHLLINAGANLDIASQVRARLITLFCDKRSLNNALRHDVLFVLSTRMEPRRSWLRVDAQMA
jgi:hypothetical protein